MSIISANRARHGPASEGATSSVDCRHDCTGGLRSSLGIYYACDGVVESEPRRSRIQVDRKNSAFRARAAKLLACCGMAYADHHSLL